MRSNIFTIQDYTNSNDAVMDVWIEELRREARNRVNRNNFDIPAFENELDFDIIQRINNDDELLNFRVGIMLNLAESIPVCDPNTHNFILRFCDIESITRISEILRLPSNFNNYGPILNLILLGVVNDATLNPVIQELLALIQELRVDMEDRIDINVELNEAQEKVNEELDNILEDTKEKQDKLDEEGSRERSNYLNRINWRSIARRAGVVFIGALAMYAGSPYVGPTLGLIGERLMESNNQISDRPWSIPWSRNSEISWETVSRSFWTSWGLFAQYMKGKDN